MILPAIGMPGVPEMMIVLVVVLILFGAGKLPQVFKSFGEGIKAFRDAQKDEAIDVSKRLSDDEGVSEAHEVEKERTAI